MRWWARSPTSPSARCTWTRCSSAATGSIPSAGLTTPNLAEAETNRAFVKAARKVTVVADHTKWGIVGLSSFADLDEVDTLITDSGLPDEARTPLADRVGQLIIANE